MPLVEMVDAPVPPPPCGHTGECGCGAASGYLGRWVCCLECPFAVCVLDAGCGDGRAWQRGHLQRSGRVEEARGLSRRGFTYREIGQRMGASPRTVARLVRGT